MQYHSLESVLTIVSHQNMMTADDNNIIGYIYPFVTPYINFSFPYSGIDVGETYSKLQNCWRLNWVDFLLLVIGVLIVVAIRK